MKKMNVRIDTKQVDKVKKDAEKALAKATQSLQKAQKDVAKRIRENPEHAVLIAAAVGAAVGALATIGVMKRKKK